jgi:hypothetical protein
MNVLCLILLFSHFIKLLFCNINLIDTESFGHVGWMAFVDTEYHFGYCELGSCCAGKNMMMIILASVCVRVRACKLWLYFPKLGDVIHLPPSIVTCDFTVVSLKAFYDLLLKLTWARFFASLYLAI